MKENTRYKFLTFVCLAVFSLWLTIIGWHVYNAQQGSDTPYKTKIISEGVISLKNARSAQRFGYTGSYSSPQPATGFPARVGSFSASRSDIFSGSTNAVPVRHVTGGGIAAPSVSHLSSSRTLHSYASGSGAGNMSAASVSTGNSVTTAQISANFALSAVNARLLASNNITTSASSVTGGVTTLDSDAPAVIRRGPTPGDPEEDELPIDGHGSLPSAVFLTALAVAYGMGKNKLFQYFFPIKFGGLKKKQ